MAPRVRKKVVVIMDETVKQQSTSFKFIALICIVLLFFYAENSYAQTCIGATPTGTDVLSQNLEQNTTNSAGLAAATPEECCFKHETNRDCQGVLLDPLPATPVEGKTFWLSGSICLVQTIIAQSMFRVYCTLLDDWGNVLSASVTLYFIFYFIALLFGIKNTSIHDGILVFAKAIIIIWIVSDPHVVFNYLYRGFLYFMDGVSTQLACSVTNGATCTNAEMTAMKAEDGGVFANLDLMFNAMIGIESNVAYVVALFTIALIFFFTGFGIPIAIGLLGSYFAILKAFVWMLVSYITAFISVIFLLVFSPIFFTCLLFDTTRPFFNRWMGNLISYAFQPVLIVAFLFMIGEAARIGALFEQINTLKLATGSLEACDKNPRDTDTYHISEQYGLYDIDNRFIPMLIFYTWDDLDDPPVCAYAGGPTIPTCPFYVQSTDAAVCSNGTICFQYGRNIARDGDPTFDARYCDVGGASGSFNSDGDCTSGVTRYTSVALAQLDGNTNTGVNVSGANARRHTATPYTGPNPNPLVYSQGLDPVECGVTIISSSLSWLRFSFPWYNFRDPIRKYPVPAHFFGPNQPNPTSDALAPIPAINPVGTTAGDTDAFYMYSVSISIALKVLVALIVVWYIVSKTMESFLAKVPEFARFLVQFEGNQGSAVLTGQSPTFSSISNSEAHGLTAPGDVAGNYQYAGGRSHDGKATVYTSLGALAGGVGALGKLANIGLSVVPGVRDVYQATKSSISSQKALANSGIQGWQKSGGWIGRHMSNNARLKKGDSILRTGVDPKHLNPLSSRAELSAYENPFASGSASYKAFLKDRGKNSEKLSAELSSAKHSLKNSLGLSKSAALSSDGVLRPQNNIAPTEFVGANKPTKDGDSPVGGPTEYVGANKPTKDGDSPVGGPTEYVGANKNTARRENVNLGSKPSSYKNPYAAVTGPGLSMKAVGEVLSVSGASGLGGLLRATATAKMARNLNQSKATTPEKNTPPRKPQKRDSARKILASAKRIRNAQERNKKSYLVQPKANVSLTGMGGTFVKSLVSGAGVERSLQNAMESGLKKAERNARALGNKESLARIRKTQNKFSTTADNFKASQQSTSVSRPERNIVEQPKAQHISEEQKRAQQQNENAQDQKSLKTVQARQAKEKSAIHEAQRQERGLARNRKENKAIRELQDSGKSTKEYTDNLKEQRNRDIDFKALKKSLEVKLGSNVYEAVDLRRAEKKIVDQSKAEGRSIEETKERLKEYRDDKEFIRSGRTSQERAQRKEEIQKLRDNSNNATAQAQKDITEYKSNQSAPTESAPKTDFRRSNVKTDSRRATKTDSRKDINKLKEKWNKQDKKTQETKTPPTPIATARSYDDIVNDFEVSKDGKKAIKQQLKDDKKQVKDLAADSTGREKKAVKKVQKNLDSASKDLKKALKDKNATQEDIDNIRDRVERTKASAEKAKVFEAADRKIYDKLITTERGRMQRGVDGAARNRQLLKENLKNNIPVEQAIAQLEAEQEVRNRGKAPNKQQTSKFVTKDIQMMLEKKASAQDPDHTRRVFTRKERSERRDEFHQFSNSIDANLSERSVINQSRRDGLTIEETRDVIKEMRAEKSSEAKEKAQQQLREDLYKAHYQKAEQDFEINMSEIRLTEKDALKDVTDKQNKGRTEAEKLDSGQLTTLAAQQKELLQKGYSKEDIIEAMTQTRVELSMNANEAQNDRERYEERLEEFRNDDRPKDKQDKQTSESNDQGQSLTPSDTATEFVIENSRKLEEKRKKDAEIAAQRADEADKEERKKKEAEEEERKKKEAENDTNKP